MHRGVVAVAAAVLIGQAAFAQAADLAGTVRDAAGNPLADAVFFAIPRNTRLPPLPAAAAPTAIDQVNSQFPFVTPVRTGTPVVFRNADTYGHTVYSVSSTKVFDSPLSRDVVSAPVSFDKPNVVVIGCSIHDFMVGYLLIVDTPYFAVTNGSGTAVLRGLAQDTHDVYVWHPGMPAPTAAQEVVVTNAAIVNVEFRVGLRPDGLRPDGLWRIDRNNPVGRYVAP